MHPRITKEIQEKWPQYEFIGVPFEMKDGKTYMRAISKIFDTVHFYCFEDDFFWFDRPEFK